MKFNTTEDALEWFFSKKWLSRPSKLKAYDLFKIRNPYHPGDTEDTLKTHAKISYILDTKLKARNYLILESQFTPDSKPQWQIANDFDLSSDRSVRDVRDRTLKKLDKAFRKAGLLSKPCYEEPVYAHG